MNEIPPGFEDVLSSYGPVLIDMDCGEPIAWGFKIHKYLGPERFESLRKFGHLQCIVMGEWALVTKWLTPDEARAKYGEVTRIETGPQGGFRSVTYGMRTFMNRRMRPSRGHRSPRRT
jgi:hypothetical protein